MTIWARSATINGVRCFTRSIVVELLKECVWVTVTEPNGVTAKTLAAKTTPNPFESRLGRHSLTLFPEPMASTPVFLTGNCDTVHLDAWSEAITYPPRVDGICRLGGGPQLGPGLTIKTAAETLAR